jgi:hypothetical protein
MSNTIKILGIAIGTITLSVVIFAAYIQMSPLPTFENKAIEISISPDSLKLAEGEKLVKTLCSMCHMSADGKLGGKHMTDASQFGTIYSTNISNHPEHGKLAQYSDGELAYLIRTGIKKDGNYAPPWMVKLPRLSDYDMESLISFLRSGHPLMNSSNTPNQNSEFNFLSKMLIKLGVFAPLTYDEGPIQSPLTSDKVAYGKYLALSKYDCYACHSEDFAKCDFQDPENSVGFLGGGNPIPDLTGKPILSSNLTMDKETGLGKWTEEEFIQAVKIGLRKNNISNRYPMLPFTLLEDEEVSAIWAYLQTVPVIHNPNDFTPDDS